MHVYRLGFSRATPQQLVDFGLGVRFSEEDEKFHQDVGSLYYVAPEVLGRNYTKVVASMGLIVSVVCRVVFVVLSCVCPALAARRVGP